MIPQGIFGTPQETRNDAMWLALNPSVFRYTCQTNVAGPERDRTADLLNANQALSQLSYRPVAGHGDMVERFVAKSKVQIV